ncbi:hypothetical protein PMI42_04893 [Bradyrhizobium sp. YR681]|uniref:hypothetical protein n=1 Tax=Bradyrhizobium sp. YR681 TaxID=1144344 RepID=UPI00027114AA|nr:hypothetical protein [Bradyrhizobium sp. YR681]EJN11878.1 hypothetical protein PMI42_04893 [Bradyrhizobium sp. YR681]
MPDDLTLRRTVIGGETVPGDYVVIWDGITIGRIFKTVAVGGKDGWQWSCGLPNVPQRSAHRGRAGSLEAAKIDFRTAWTEVQTQLSYDEIRQARAIDADRSRPWHRRG